MLKHDYYGNYTAESFAKLPLVLQRFLSYTQYNTTSDPNSTTAPSTEAQVAYLNGDKTPTELKELGYTGLDYAHKVLKKNSHWIDEAHKLGLTVNVWTVNKAEDLQYFIDHKADYITTNEPALLLEMLKKR